MYKTEYKPLLLVWTVFMVLLVHGYVIAQKPALNPPGPVAKATLLSSYTTFESDESSMVIDKLLIEISRDPADRGVIVVYCGKTCQYGEVEAHLLGIRLSLKYKGFDSNKVVVISGGYKEKTTTEFWAVPKDACFPVPDSTVAFKDVIFKGNFKKKIVPYECCF
jgi:hypothetical protein